ncbi:unnamed protein product [Thlaspi arvense]|uniref:Uncharacterized protein n=1 Tax=Thlaspi arvense TaxID=13288 RepID=A0AAU9RK13_THLAR|nr:unnamed protein product [Thlaspi arvense]
MGGNPNGRERVVKRLSRCSGLWRFLNSYIATLRGEDADLRKQAKWKLGWFLVWVSEYTMQGRLSEKSDAFSFVMLLVEIVSGKRSTSFYDNKQAFNHLGLAWRLWNEDKIFTLIDPRISYQGFGNEILRYLHVSLLCVQAFSTHRPTISRFLSMLGSETTILPSPNQPTFLRDIPHIGLILLTKAIKDVL